MISLGIFAFGINRAGLYASVRQSILFRKLGVIISVTFLWFLGPISYYIEGMFWKKKTVPAFLRIF
jgi:hypothetical protein